MIPGDLEVAEAVKELRLALNQTQQEFSAVLGVTLSTVARWETKKPPRGLALSRLSYHATRAGRKDLADFFNARYKEAASGKTELAEAIRKVRVLMGDTQEEFSRRFGLSLVSLKRYESNYVPGDFGLRKIGKLANNLRQRSDLPNVLLVAPAIEDLRIVIAKTASTAFEGTQLAAAIKRLRLALGDDQAQFADRAKASVASISRYERNAVPNSVILRRLYRLADEKGLRDVALVLRKTEEEQKRHSDAMRTGRRVERMLQEFEESEEKSPGAELFSHRGLEIPGTLYSRKLPEAAFQREPSGINEYLVPTKPTLRDTLAELLSAKQQDLDHAAACVWILNTLSGRPRHRFEHAILEAILHIIRNRSDEGKPLLSSEEQELLGPSFAQELAELQPLAEEAVEAFEEERRQRTGETIERGFLLAEGKDLNKKRSEIETAMRALEAENMALAMRLRTYEPFGDLDELLKRAAKKGEVSHKAERPH